MSAKVAKKPATEACSRNANQGNLFQGSHSASVLSASVQTKTQLGDFVASDPSACEFKVTGIWKTIRFEEEEKGKKTVTFNLTGKTSGANLSVCQERFWLHKG